MIGGTYIVGLDIGTTKICVVVGRVGERGIEIIGSGKVPCAGLKKGVIVDMDATVKAIKDVLLETESSCGVLVHSAYVGLATGQVKCLEGRGATGVMGKEITNADIKRAVDSASNTHIPVDREILHLVPSDYAVDGHDSVLQPVGMSGRRIEAKVNIITAPMSMVDNIVSCCERADLDVKSIVVEPIASARAVLRPDEMHQGSAIVDIGGGTTDIAIYRNGRLRHASVIPVGGNHFTNDLAVGLRISMAEAERIKIAHGTACIEGIEESRVEVQTLKGDGKIVMRSLIAGILGARATELFGLVKAELKNELIYGVTLTGGTSLLRSISSVAEDVTGYATKLGIPGVEVSAGDRRGRDMRSAGVVRNPIYSTAVGLCLYGYDALPKRTVQEDLIEKFLGKIWTIGESIKTMTTKI